MVKVKLGFSYEKSWKQGNPLSNAIKETSTIMRNPSSLIALLRGFPCFHDFSHGPSHPYIPILNDFCTCNVWLEAIETESKRLTFKHDVAHLATTVQNLPIVCSL